MAGILIGYFGRNAALELFRQKGFEHKTHVSVNIGKNDIATKNNATRKTNNTDVQTDNATRNTNVAQTDNATRKKQMYKEKLNQLSERNLNGLDDSNWEKDPGGDKIYDTHGSDCPEPYRNWCPVKFPDYCGKDSKGSPGWCVERETNCNLKKPKINGAPAYYYSKAFRDANVKEGNELNRLYVQDKLKTGMTPQKLEYPNNQYNKKSHTALTKGLPFTSDFDQQKKKKNSCLNVSQNTMQCLQKTIFYILGSTHKRKRFWLLVIDIKRII